MSFRGTDPNLQAYLRGLEDRLRRVERGTGQVRQNTIRLGNWVLEAEGDSYVKMTNLVTGAESRVGDPTEVVFPDSAVPWSYAGVVNPDADVLPATWSHVNAIRLKRLTVEFQTPGTVPYTVNTRVGGVSRGTHTINAGESQRTWPLDINVGAGVKFWPLLSANASGDAEDMSITYWFEELE